MLSTDSRRIQENIDSITLNTIAKIQKELPTYDLRSLVFLLYQRAETALERLTLLQRVSKDIHGSHLNLLQDWAIASSKDPNWKLMLLESFAICKLDGIIRRHGFNVSSVKSSFLPDASYCSTYVDIMKKSLYMLCENIDENSLCKIKNSLMTYGIDVMPYESCEMIILHLIVLKKISLVDIEFLASVIERIPSISTLAADLRETQKRILKNAREELDSKKSSIECSIIHSSPKKIEEKNESTVPQENKKIKDSFQDIFQMINDLCEKDVTLENFKSDKAYRENSYPIEDGQHIGFTLIINQESFYPSRNSVKLLYDREGSAIDKAVLTKTFQKMNFDVLTKDNLSSVQIVPEITSAIQMHFKPQHSVFVLVIMSHGIKRHIYGADSIAVEVQKIQDSIDNIDGRILAGIPKVMIIQACQTDNEHSPNGLVADGPQLYNILKRSDFLIYWAAAADYEAYRSEKSGTVFIQTLCRALNEKAQHEQVDDIFKCVTEAVTVICLKNNKAQLPIIESTLRKKLFLSV